jgi:hypothetical protein
VTLHLASTVSEMGGWRRIVANQLNVPAKLNRQSPPSERPHTGCHCWLVQQCMAQKDSAIQRLRSCKPLWLTCLSVIHFLLTIAPAQAQYSPDERYLSALRANRLFDLAEEVCRNRLSASKLTPRERIILTIERILVLTEKGVNAPLADRPTAFEAARKVAADFKTNFADEPRGLLVQFQDALTLLTLGELQRLEAELGTASPADIETAKNTLRDAVKLLEAFDAELQRRIPDARRGPGNKPTITADELTTLRTHVGFQIARAARNQALLYPEKGEDRTASLLRGKRQLEEAVLAVAEEEPLYWQASTELATFARMLGEPGRADQLLDELNARNPPPSVIPLIRAEEIRVMITLGKATEAAEKGAKWAEGAAPRDADLDLAVLEAIAADAKQAKTTDALMEKLTEIENRHGPYWGRRASALVLKSAPAGMASESLELLSRTADQLFLQKNYDAAIASYDRAAQKAKEAGKGGVFVEQSMKAALVEQERKGYSEAARRFLEIAAQPEAQAKAAETHLAAAWNQLQLVRAMPTDTNIFVQLEEILNNHIYKFKESPSASTAKLWLAREYMRQGNYKDAIVYANWVPITAKESDEAIDIGLRYWRLQEKDFDDGKFYRAGPAVEWSKTTAGTLSSAMQRKACVAGLRWQLLFPNKEDYAQIEARLRELLEKTPATETETASAAQMLLVIALAAQPEKLAEAGKLLEDPNATASQRLTTILGLVKLAKGTVRDLAKPGRGEIPKLAFTAIEKLRPKVSELKANERTLLDLAYVETLAATPDREKAQAAFEAAAKKYADSAIIQEAYAEFLTEQSRSPPAGGIGGPPGGIEGVASRSPDISNKALDQWRLVASRSQPKTDRWYRAKYHVAEIQFQMGQKTEAAKLIDYLDALPPGLKGAPMEVEFRALRKQCGDAAANR